MSTAVPASFLGSFRLGFRGLRSSGHLRLLEADQQPRLRRVRAKVHEATGNILSQILQARFDDCVVGSDSPSNPLRLFLSTWPEIGDFSPLSAFW